MNNKKFRLLFLGFVIAIAACAPKSNLFIREATLAKATKKIAVFPFQDANLRASDDTSVPRAGMLTLKFLEHAEPVLASRYQFIPQDKIMAALKEAGFEGYDPNKSMLRQASFQTTGYTIPQAVEIARNLGADAVFLGEVAGMQFHPVFSISVRMLDTKTGKVIVAASATAGRGLNFTPWNEPMKKIVSRFAQEVP